MSVTTEEMKTVKFHQISLGLLRKKFGNISEEDAVVKIMEDINVSEETKFEDQSASFHEKMAIDKVGGNYQGYNLSYYSRMVKVLHPMMAHYGCPVEHGVPREERFVFHARPGFLLVVTVRSSWELLQDYTCKQFPLKVANLAGQELVRGWRIFSQNNPLYKCAAFKDKLSQDIKLKPGNGFIEFNLDKKFKFYGIPEILNYLIEECKLCNVEEPDTTLHEPCTSNN